MNNYSTQLSLSKQYLPALFLTLGLFLLLEYARSIHYLFFHTMLEGFAVMVSLSIFVLAWASNRNLANGYLIILGSAYGAISFIDSFHILTFKGMNLFPGVSLNYTNQFWLTARFMEAAALLLAPLFILKKPNFIYFSAGFLALALSAGFAIINQIFPATFIDGVGLSPFKIYSEYVIISMMSLALFLLYRCKAQFDKKLFFLLMASLLFAIAGEFCFTLYVGFYDFSHALGHYFRFTSVVLAFVAIVLSGVRHPLDLLFREINRNQKTLEALNAQLSESELRYRLAFSTGPDAININRLSDGLYLDVNEAFLRMSGWSREEVIGKTSSDIGIWHDVEDRQRLVNTLLRDGHCYNLEAAFVMKDGRILTAQMSAHVITLAGESCILSMTRDVTERKQNELRLERLTNEQKAMLETELVGIVRLMNRKVEWVNPAFEHMMGYEHGELIGTSTRIHYLSEAAYLGLAEAAYSLLASGQVYRTQIELIRKDGKHIWVDLSGTRLDEKTGESLWGFLDITEQIQAVTDLKQSASTLHALINANTETALLLDSAGTILTINEVGAQRLRKPQATLIGDNFYAQLPAELALARQADALKVFQSGLAMQTQDERAGIRFANSIYPVFGAEGKVVNIAVYATDVTERMQLQGIDQLFFNINQKLLQGQSIDDLFDYVCAEVPLIFGYQNAWIGSKEADGSVAVRAALNNREALENMKVRWDDTSHSRGPTGAAIHTGQAQVFKVTDSRHPPWLEAIQAHGFSSFLALPMIVRGEMIGAFSLYSKYAHSFDSPEIIQRLSGITSLICVAVETAQDQQQLMLLRSALAATANGVFIADKSGKILWINQAFTYLTGFSEEESIGMTPRLLNANTQHPANYENLWASILRGEVWRNEMEELHKDGTTFFVRQTITPIFDSEGAISNFITILEDISVEKEAKDRIEHLAHYDALTQLPNRALFRDRLRQALSSAKRANDVVALMFLDLDHFKQVNDRYGHQTGDTLLQHVASRLRSCVRESDTVARLAGDEFTIILPEIASAEDAQRVADKIIDAFAIEFNLEGNTFFSSTSIGIALYPTNATEEDRLLNQADTAMYQAKQAGKNQFCFA
jgi:diguanylate cyclase (GGDEF)-like protein/PAS domain S-box-containing protein